jgi:hypothetical protein
MELAGQGEGEGRPDTGRPGCAVYEDQRWVSGRGSLFEVISETVAWPLCIEFVTVVDPILRSRNIMKID